jgi:hypothetical protein
MENENISLFVGVYGNADPVAALSDGETLGVVQDEGSLVKGITGPGDEPHPLEKVFARARDAARSGGSLCASWDEPFINSPSVKVTAPAEGSADRSAARLAKFEAAVQRLFGDSEEGKQVLEIGRRQLAEASAEVLVANAA